MEVNKIIIIIIIIIINHNFLTCAKAEIDDLTVCIVLNGEKFQSHTVTLTLIIQCPMSNCPSYFQILQHVQVSSGLNHYFLSCRVHRHTHRRKDGKTRTQTDMSTL